MAQTFRTTHAAAGRDSAGLLATLAARLDRWRTYRRTLSELSQLTDRELADIGTHRALIHDLARETASRV